MNYRKNKKGEDLSILGFGCMRFSKKGNAIDIDKTEKEIKAAYEAGVNYYDTAYIYPGSEAALGEILERLGIRDEINIATKLPQYLIKSSKSIEKYFDEQCKRLRTDHIDYYLMHMLTDIEAWNNLKKLGIEEWIAEAKSSGKIRNIGFSFHGNTDMFLQILNAYDWDFCQVQYNYLDEHTQAGRRGVEEAHKKGIPVIIMEPLRGGRLVNLLPAKAKKIIAENPRGYSAAEWGFRWLWNQDSVTVVLSGMNSPQMVEENLRVASTSTPGMFTAEDDAAIDAIRNAIREKIKVGCTGCGYCMPCPKGVDIPALFRCYNQMYTENKAGGRKEYFQTVGIRKDPAIATQCIGCGKCEKHCPQGIEIRKMIKEADKEVRTLQYKVMMKAARWWMFRK